MAADGHAVTTVTGEDGEITSADPDIGSTPVVGGTAFSGGSLTSSGTHDSGHSVEGHSDKRSGVDAPNEVVRSRTAVGSQSSSPVQETSSGEMVTARELPIPSRSRKTRVPLNISVLGDVERVFSINEYDIEYIYAMSNSLVDTNNTSDVLLYEDILGAPEGERHKWINAGKEELISIVRDNQTWVPWELPIGAKALMTKWLFKRKRERGKPHRYKARLCVRGFEQREGLDYGETYAPTAKWVTLRLFLTICCCVLVSWM